MRYLPVLAVCVLAASCASLESDLKTADAKCPQVSAMAAFVACLNQNEEPVWRHDAPEAMADYQTFAAARMALAEDLDSGKITPAQFRDGAAAARTRFSALMAESAKSQQNRAQAQRAEDDMQQMMQHTPPAGMDGMGMGGMNSMGM